MIISNLREGDRAMPWLDIEYTVKSFDKKPKKLTTHVSNQSDWNEKQDRFNMGDILLLKVDGVEVNPQGFSFN